MKGKCINLDDNCPNFNKIIEVPDDKDFVCPKCGHPLYEVEDGPSGSGNRKLVVIISVAVVVVIAAVVLIMTLGSGGDRPSPQPFIPEPSPLPLPDPLPAPLPPGSEPAVTPPCTVYVSNPGDTIVITIDTSLIDIRYSFAWYEGSTKTFNINGSTMTVANGSGTLHFTARAPVPSRNPDFECIAEPGDYVSGQWQNGALVSGKIYRKNNRLKKLLEPGASRNHEPVDLEKLYRKFCQSEK